MRTEKGNRVISIILIFLTIITTLNISMLENKVEAAVSPYRYRMVVAYFGYWKSGNTYYATLNNVVTNIGSNPASYLVKNWTFPVALINGNYEIEEIMNYRDYDGSWSDLNYFGLTPEQVNSYYMSSAYITNTSSLIGEKNTTVSFTANYYPLDPSDAEDVGGGTYKCYIAIVIKYVDSDYKSNPPKWEEEHNGSGNINVTVQYKDEDGKKLMNDKTRKTSLGANLIENAERIDGYRCIGYSVTGKETKSLSGNSTSFVVGLLNYSTPVNNNLNITFHYEEYKEPEKPKCDPQFDADADDTRITMKRKSFETATDIYFSNVRIAVDDFEGGLKQVSGTKWEEVEGEHKFHSFDIYLKYPGSSGYDYTRYDIYSQTANINLNVPASKFTPTNTEKTEYVAEVEVTLGVLCSCGGFNAEKTTLRLYVDIVENQPPDAYYRYATKKALPNGTEIRVYNKAYIGKDVVIDNYSSDPNGLTDIDYSRFIFRNDSGQVKSLQFKMMPWGAYELDEYDLFDDTSIYFTGIENGNLRVIFNTDEEWEVTVYVQDTEGLSDSYTEIIKPEELTLKPTAVIKDVSNYRYSGEEFSGKQNRVIKLNSNNSYIASWLQDFENITIDHSKDMWQIEALDGQDINSVKFERDVNKIISGNVLNARYEHLDIKIMFKESGRYKIRLQVSDTEGNTSDWAEQIITIYNDLIPQVVASISNRYYRDGTGYVNISINNITSNSLDGDTAILEKIEYQYDANNNGNFDDETLKQLGTAYLKTKDLGKYRFKVTVKENFGQETLIGYITDYDYKRGHIYLTTEVDNVAPSITKFKIMTAN